MKDVSLVHQVSDTGNDFVVTLNDRDRALGTAKRVSVDLIGLGARGVVGLTKVSNPVPGSGEVGRRAGTRGVADENRGVAEGHAGRGVGHAPAPAGSGKRARHGG